MSDFDPTMLPALQHTFVRHEGQVLYAYVIDRSSIIGPRIATDADKAAHPAEWEAFQASEAAFNGADASKFDHDGNGSPGGAKPRGTKAAK